MSANDTLIIFDTTLRDGEQSPGASMTQEEKLRIAKALERMQVDVIEAGFAIASQGDFESVKAVADTIKESRVCSLARGGMRISTEPEKRLKTPMPAVSTHLLPPHPSTWSTNCG